MSDASKVTETMMNPLWTKLDPFAEGPILRRLAKVSYYLLIVNVTSQTFICKRRVTGFADVGWFASTSTILPRGRGDVSHGEPNILSPLNLTLLLR
mmetsp:Transcript_7993/g.14731  ORF Transcript_7993/g.14731 Transcript_7993/m.14731 type:complete len:96 (+) Transcript_7993:51-338(+)